MRDLRPDEAYSLTYTSAPLCAPLDILGTRPDKPVYGERNPVQPTPPGRDLINDLLHSGSTWTVD